MVDIGVVIYWVIYIAIVLIVVGDFAIPPYLVIYTTLILLIMIFFTLMILYVGNFYDIGFSMIGYIAIIGFLSLILIGVFVYHCWSTMPNVNLIQNKVKNRYQLITTYSQHITSDDIYAHLGHRFVPVNTIKSFKEIWEDLMTNNSESQIKNKLQDILNSDINLDADIDVHYNLIWYLCLSNRPFNNRLTLNEKRYILRLNEQELENLLGADYIGNKDRASMIFTALSGQYVPLLKNSRYETVKNYDPTIIYNLTSNIFDDGSYSIYPPYLYLASRPISELENVIINLPRNNNQELIDKLGLIVRNELNEEEKYKFIQKELSGYHNVLTRGPDYPIYQLSSEIDPDEITHILSHYTNKELVDEYEPRFNWTNRYQLIQNIKNDILGIPRWSFVHRFCNNDETMNIITAELHGEVNKDDSDDPTLSYGTHKNYKCYQMSELVGSFRENNGIFIFAIPDSLNNEEFQLDSIKQLRDLLVDESKCYPLMAKINEGLNMLDSIEAKLKYIRNQYNGFDSDQQELIKIYLVWMFMDGMWMRFWKGPGNPWPILRTNTNRIWNRAVHNRTSPQERDEHVFIQNQIRTQIIERYENDNTLKKWIEDLPVIYYDFETQEAKIAGHTILSVLNNIAIGGHCMGFGADTVVKTAYYYINYMLDVPNFNSFIRQYIPIINEMEMEVVLRELETTNNPYTTKYRVLNGRLSQLQQPQIEQEDFSPIGYQNNFHSD